MSAAALDVAIGHALGGFALEVAFRVEAGGVTALFGPSGAGKSTTAQAIAGLLRPDRGRIALGETVFFDAGTRRDLPSRRRRIGYVFQDARLFPHLTVAANLAYGARRSPEPPGAAERGRALATLGIDGLLARRVAGLSGGERARVALGRALLSGPRLLILDEPLASLDAPRRAEILPYLERLRDGVRLPILYISHSLDEVTRLADRMILLSGGRVAASGAVEEIMGRLDLFPLTGRFEAGAVIRGRLAGHEGGLARVDTPGGRLTVPPIEAAAGSEVRLRIRARDVMVATAPPDGISARNVLAGRVAEIRPESGPYVDILIDCAGLPLIARITAEARAALALEPGRAVWAVIKTVSIARASGGPAARG